MNLTRTQSQDFERKRGNTKAKRVKMGYISKLLERQDLFGKPIELYYNDNKKV